MHPAPVTVMLDLVWVLESRDCAPGQIGQALTALLDLPNFKPKHADAVPEALRSYSEGMGFADGLHLALSSGDQPFLAFDKAFARQVKKLGLQPPVRLA